MTEYIELVCVPIMSTAIYWIMATLKFAFKGNKIFARIVPLLALVLGAIMGAVIYYVVPKMIMAENILISIVMGAASGLTSIGAEELMHKIAPSKKNKNTIALESDIIEAVEYVKEKEDYAAGNATFIVTSLTKSEVSPSPEKINQTDVKTEVKEAVKNEIQQKLDSLVVTINNCDCGECKNAASNEKKQ